MRLARGMVKRYVKLCFGVKGASSTISASDCTHFRLICMGFCGYLRSVYITPPKLPKLKHLASYSFFQVELTLSFVYFAMGRISETALLACFALLVAAQTPQPCATPSITPSQFANIKFDYLIVGT